MAFLPRVIDGPMLVPVNLGQALTNPTLRATPVRANHTTPSVKIRLGNEIYTKKICSIAKIKRVA